jgi:hypothetical protein
MSDERDADDLMWEQEFAQHFGHGLIDALRTAAVSHNNGTHDDAKGNPFRWSLVICIGHQCFEVESYRTFHGITEPYATIKAWCVDRNILATYAGDVDYLALLSGVYNDWIGRKEEAFGQEAP